MRGGLAGSGNSKSPDTANQCQSAEADKSTGDRATLYGGQICCSAERIIPQQKTAPHRAIHHMPKRNVIRRKHFPTSQPCHDQLPFIIEHGLKQRLQFYLPPVACKKMLCLLRALLADDDGVKSQ